jgi:hypothetical protein
MKSGIKEISAPLPYVSAGVEEPVPVWGERVGGRSSSKAVSGSVVAWELSLEDVHAMLAFWLPLISPGVALLL